MMEHTFLIEIGTDELPSKILKKLGKDFLKHIKDEFNANNIRYDSIHWFAAPRNLAVKSKILITDHTKNHIFRDYKNNKKDSLNYNIKTKHSDLFINNDITIKNSFKEKKTNKNFIQTIVFKKLLLQIVNNSLKKFINYKMMRWGDGYTSFIRPVNTVTVLLDSDIIKGRFFEINTDRIIYGHRYIKNNQIIINDANDYPDILIKEGCVIADYYTRKEVIKTKVKKKAAEFGGVVNDIQDNNFLEEITSLIEWPIVLFGKFNKRFLKLPFEIIIHIMKHNQKYFPVYNTTDGTLIPGFIVVINTITTDYKKIIQGHENVITARFIDAEFFLKKDNQFRLEHYIPQLNSILFHRKLGSLRNKVDRITELSGWIANQINADIEQTKRASYLCKCDLATNMVLEFPEMQGVIGMYYAQRDGETKKVALAQKEHYKPKYTTDELPTEQISCIVSIADKMDTISGIFGIKDFPTGSRDPFGLKRISGGILNIIIQKKIYLNLFDLVCKSVDLYENTLTNTISTKHDIYNFMYNRLYKICYSKGFKINIIKSVLNMTTVKIADCIDRIQAIDIFYRTQQEKNIKLNTVYKRISNILKNQKNFLNKKVILADLFEVSEEKQLFTQIIEIEKKIHFFLKQKNYYDSLVLIVSLSEQTNNLLDRVLIMDKNQHIKTNRLLLLKKVKNLFLNVVNLSELYS